MADDDRLGVDQGPSGAVLCHTGSLGTLYEIDVGTYGDSAADSSGSSVGEGETTAVTFEPPTLTLEPQLPNQDVYEVRIYDSRRNRRLVAAIEIVSPSNKDRPETRGTFVSKIAALLKHDICVSIVDVVSTRDRPRGETQMLTAAGAQSGFQSVAASLGCAG